MAFSDSPMHLTGQHCVEEQTKSRPGTATITRRQNGAIVRKHLGYSHIPQRFATLVNAFCRDSLNPCINFHRPCLFAQTITDSKGRQRKRYPQKTDDDPPTRNSDRCARQSSA